MVTNVISKIRSLQHIFLQLTRRNYRYWLICLALYIIYTFIVKQHHSFECFPWCDQKIINKMKQKGVILFNKGSWIRWLTAKLLSVRCRKYGQACDIKCLKDKFLKLENFVCDLIFSGRLLKVIEILFRKLLSLGALRMLTSRIGKRWDWFKNWL